MQANEQENQNKVVEDDKQLSAEIDNFLPEDVTKNPVMMKEAENNRDELFTEGVECVGEILHIMRASLAKGKNISAVLKHKNGEKFKLTFEKI